MFFGHVFVIPLILASVLLTGASSAMAACADVELPTAFWSADNTPFDAVMHLSATASGDAGFTAGVAGRAFAFDGVDDFRAIANNPSLDFGTGDFTVAFWKRRTDGSAGEAVLVESWNENGNLGWTLSERGGTLYFAGGDRGVTDFFGTSSIFGSNWFHIAVTRSSGIVTLYVNGAPAGAKNFGTKNFSTGLPILLGRRRGGQGFFFPGALDSVLIYSGRALSRTQLTAIWQAGKGGLCVFCRLNGIVEGFEECDDGNNSNGDACTTACTVAVCGDGEVRAGVEECDDANDSDNDACRNGCILNVCGDGAIRSGIEACDDGNLIDGDGCDADCRLSCGNGTVDSGEECDDGNNVSGDGCDGNCSVTACGNGIVAGTAAGYLEECDDGNADDLDDCRNSCVWRRCGDGVVSHGERCEDGNLIDDDACGNDCFTINGCPNGVLSDGEECDDGNHDNGDGCTNNCTGPRCGDGVLSGDEQCDDGNTAVGDSCDPNCRPPGCGNGYPGPGEACDDGNRYDGDGCDSNCVVSACGNGVVTPGRYYVCADGQCGDQCSAWWDGSLGAVGGPIRTYEDRFESLVVDGDEVFMGGHFGTECPNDVPFRGIVGWSPSTGWHALGGGICAGGVKAVAKIGGTVFAGGRFQGYYDRRAPNATTSVACIAKWNGESWSAVGENPWGNGEWGGAPTPNDAYCDVSSLLALGNDLYVGGEFATIDGASRIANNVARWDGSQWSTLGAGIAGAVYDLVEYRGEVVAASDAGVQRWDGREWVGLGNIPGAGRLASDGDSLWALTSVPGLEGATNSAIARWDGMAWQIVFSADVAEFFPITIEVHRGELYVGGYMPDGVSPGIARWDGRSLVSLGSGVQSSVIQNGQGEVNHLVSFGDRLLAGGLFDIGGGKNVLGLAAWTPATCGEVCDDGNRFDGDGCDSNCTPTGCPNGVRTGDEECDDGNDTNGDECDSNCTAPRCGNGIVAGEEMCDDGNLIDGDGCDANCTLTPIVRQAGPGETVASQPLSEAYPIQAQLETPSGGPVSIDNLQPGEGDPQVPTGYAVVGAALKIEASAATVQDPLTIQLQVDRSAVAVGVDLAQLEVTRNGSVVPDCTGPVGVASPDPCIVSRIVEDATLTVTVLTSRASEWSTVVAPQTPDQVGCSAGLFKATAKILKAQADIIAACMKKESGLQGNALSCANADAGGKVAKTLAGLGKVDQKCKARPTVGFLGIKPISLSAVSAAQRLTDAILGPVWQPALGGSAEALACQTSLYKSAAKLLGSEMGLYNRCVQDGLSRPESPFHVNADLAICMKQLDASTSASLAKIRQAFVKKTSKICGGSLAAALAGSRCAESSNPLGCIMAQAHCRACRLAADSGGFVVDCDNLDDTQLNGSCQ